MTTGLVLKVKKFSTEAELEKFVWDLTLIKSGTPPGIVNIYVKGSGVVLWYWHDSRRGTIVGPPQVAAPAKKKAKKKVRNR